MLWVILLILLIPAGFWIVNHLVESVMIREIIRDEMSGHEPQGEALAFIQKRLKEKKQEAAGKRAGREIVYRKSDYI